MGRLTIPQHLLPTGIEVTPGRRLLDRKSMVPQVVGDFAVGVGAGVGPERSSARVIKTSRRLEQTDHCELAQIIEGMGGAPVEVAGDLVRQIQVPQRQGMGGGMGMHRPLAAVPHPGPLRLRAVGEGRDQLVVPLGGRSRRCRRRGERFTPERVSCCGSGRQSWLMAHRVSIIGSGSRLMPSPRQ